MKASFFEPVGYVTSKKMPSEWPLPPGLYEPDLGAQAFQSVRERLAFVEELGFDWVSFSEHHYAARILCPAPIVMALHVAAHLQKITIAVLGPIIPLSNPVRVAEELAMLDTLRRVASWSGCCGARRMSIWSTVSSLRRLGSAPRKAWS